MKKSFILLSLIIASVTVDAQLIKPKQSESYTITQDGQIKKRALFEKKAKEEINPKYLEGACPEVSGKIQWTEEIAVPNATAQQVYDKALTFLTDYCKKHTAQATSTTKEEASKVVTQEGTMQIGARIQQTLTFEKKFFSLDIATMNYQVIVDCLDGKCIVSMKNISYLYEEDRENSLGQISAEDMISDDSALTKDKKGFTIGGSEKFRTKTIDAKDEFFELFKNAMK